MSAVRQILIGVHVIAGLLLVGMLCRSLGDRAQEVNQVRIEARHEHARTLALESEIARMDELRKGLERQDAYVVELLAREKLGMLGPGEMVPPPAPTVASDSVEH